MENWPLIVTGLVILFYFLEDFNMAKDPKRNPEAGGFSAMIFSMFVLAIGVVIFVNLK